MRAPRPAQSTVPQRVGIVLMSALGDVTLGLPVATAIKRASPWTRITWIAQPGPIELLRGHPAVDEIVRFDRWDGVAGYRTVRDRLRERSLDVVLDLQTAFKAGLVTALSGAPRRIGIDRRRAQDANWLFTNERIPNQPRAHMADQFLEFLPSIGVTDGSVEYGLRACDTTRADVYRQHSDEQRPLVTVVVASSKASKNWAPERLAALCVSLVADYGLRPVLTGGESDIEIAAAAQIMQHATKCLPAADRPIVALGCGIRALMAWIEQSVLVVSPDSGPLHMAVALERPVVGLYGATNPLWVGPYRRYHDLVVDRFHREDEAPRSSAEKRPGRMELVTVADVLERVERWRTTYAPAMNMQPVSALLPPRTAEVSTPSTATATGQPWGLTAASRRA
jgi:heptosyltransferase I